jgi:hypothetical protein
MPNVGDVDGPTVTTTVTRQDIAAHVAGAFDVTGVMKTEILRAAMNSWAPHPVVQVLLTLPEGYYRSLDEVWTRLPSVPER